MQEETMKETMKIWKQWKIQSELLTFWERNKMREKVTCFWKFRTVRKSQFKTDKEVLRNDILKSKWLWGQKFDRPRVRKSAKGNFAENALPQVMTVWRYQISEKLRFSSKIRNLLQNWSIWTVKKTNCSIFDELFKKI